MGVVLFVSFGGFVLVSGFFSHGIPASLLAKSIGDTC
jgi:hypothetical protein